MKDWCTGKQRFKHPGGHYSMEACGQHLVRSWQHALSLFEWGPSSDRESCNSLQNELLVSSRVLFWHGKEKLRSQFNHLFRLGVVHVEDVVDNESQRLSELKMSSDGYVFPILCIYLGETTIYTIVARILNKCCTLGGLTVTRWYTVVTGHYKYIVSSCNGINILDKANKLWNVCKSDARWWKILQRG